MNNCDGAYMRMRNKIAMGVELRDVIEENEYRDWR